MPFIIFNSLGKSKVGFMVHNVLPKSSGEMCFPHLLQGRQSWQHIQKASPVALTVRTNTLNAPQTPAKAMQSCTDRAAPGRNKPQNRAVKTPQGLLTLVSKNFSRPQEKQQDRANCIYTSEKENTRLLEQFQRQLSSPSWQWHFSCTWSWLQPLTKLCLGPSLVELDQQHSSRWGPCTSKTSEGQQNTKTEGSWTIQQRVLP